MFDHTTLVPGQRYRIDAGDFAGTFEGTYVSTRETTAGPETIWADSHDLNGRNRFERFGLNVRRIVGVTVVDR